MTVCRPCFFLSSPRCDTVCHRGDTVCHAIQGEVKNRIENFKKPSRSPRHRRTSRPPVATPVPRLTLPRLPLPAQQSPQNSTFEVQGNTVLPLAPASTTLYSIALLAFLTLTTSCIGPRPLKGGKALTTQAPTGAIAQTLLQGENPSQPARQDQSTIRVRTYTLPAASWIEFSPSSGGSSTRAEQRNPNQKSKIKNQKFIWVTDREETHARTELGAAQKDTARELTAKLSSLKGIVWVGLAIFIFGLASIFWAPLRAVIGSITTSAAITLGGLALMILPTLVVGHELLILAGVVLLVAGWFLAHRHGELRGVVNAAQRSPSTGEPRKLNIVSRSQQ